MENIVRIVLMANALLASFVVVFLPTQTVASAGDFKFKHLNVSRSKFDPQYLSQFETVKLQMQLRDSSRPMVAFSKDIKTTYMVGAGSVIQMELPANLLANAIPPGIEAVSLQNIIQEAERQNRLHEFKDAKVRIIKKGSQSSQSLYEKSEVVINLLDWIQRNKLTYVDFEADLNATQTDDTQDEIDQEIRWQEQDAAETELVEISKGLETESVIVPEKRKKDKKKTEGTPACVGCDGRRGQTDVQGDNLKDIQNLSAALNEEVRKYSESQEVQEMISYAWRNKESGSVSRCYAYVKDALYSAGLTSRRLSGVAPSSTAEPELKKQGFVNLLDDPDWQKVITDPSKAPYGSVLVYEGGRRLRGCGEGVDRRCGHVEIRTRDGYVSDFFNVNPVTGNPDLNPGLSGRNRKLVAVMIKPSSEFSQSRVATNP